MREAFICDGIRTPIGRYGGNCWCETRVSMRSVSMM